LGYTSVGRKKPGEKGWSLIEYSIVIKCWHSRKKSWQIHGITAENAAESSSETQGGTELPQTSELHQSLN